MLVMVMTGIECAVVVAAGVVVVCMGEYVYLYLVTCIPGLSSTTEVGSERREVHADL